MAIFEAVEGAIAHGNFAALRNVYGPESTVFHSTDHTVHVVDTGSEPGSVVGPDAIMERAKELFEGKTVHFKLQQIYSQSAPGGCHLLVGSGRLFLDATEAPFTHTFLLMPSNTDASAFYVRNEMLSVTAEPVDVATRLPVTAKAGFKPRRLAVATPASAADEKKEDEGDLDDAESSAAATDALLAASSTAHLATGDSESLSPAAVPSARLPAAVHPRTSHALHWGEDDITGSDAAAGASPAAPSAASLPAPSAVVAPEPASLPSPRTDSADPKRRVVGTRGPRSGRVGSRGRAAPTAAPTSPAASPVARPAAQPRSSPVGARGRAPRAAPAAASSPASPRTGGGLPILRVSMADGASLPTEAALAAALSRFGRLDGKQPIIRRPDGFTARFATHEAVSAAAAAGSIVVSGAKASLSDAPIGRSAGKTRGPARGSRGRASAE